MWNWLEWYEVHLAHWIQCPLISCDMLCHYLVSCMIFNWPVPKLQLIHWSRDALWLMVWYCHIIQLLYAQAIQCIIHPFHRLYTAWRPSAIIQSSTLKPGDHPSGESSKHHTSLQRTSPWLWVLYLLPNASLLLYSSVQFQEAMKFMLAMCYLLCTSVHFARCSWCRVKFMQDDDKSTALCTMPCQ